MKYFLNVMIIALSFSLVACAPDVSSSTYRAGQVGVMSQTMTGTIVGKRLVNIAANDSKVGTAVGAVGGGIAGSFIGGDIRSNLLAGLGGAVVGGIIGNAVDKKVNSQKGFEYMVRINKGKTISVTQAADNDLAIGTRVLVIYGDTVRIVPDNH